MRQLAEWLYRYRLAALLSILLVTAFFGWELRNIDISTHFRDLYPKKHPYVQLFEKYPDFGSPFTVSLIIQVKKGDIYNYETLSKIQEATRLIDLISGVNHNQVSSIASRKVKNVEATVGGIQTTTLLTGEVPQSPEEIAKLREKVRSTAGVMGTLVALKEDAAVVQATFIDRVADYGVIFKGVNGIIIKLQDKNNELYAVGQPMLIAWVYHYQKAMYKIFGLGFLIMVLLLILYSRNIVGVLAPVIVGIVSAIWGFGFAGFLGYNLDPLIIVVPILLVARGLSHAVQMCGRYFEIYQKERDVRKACVESFASLFPPGVVGIICDASGLFIIAIAPIRLIEKLAYVCGLWSLSLVVTAIVLTFLVLSYLPAPRNVDKIVISSERKQGILYNIFRFLTIFSSNPRRSIATSLFFIAMTIVSIWFATHREIGDVHIGTPLLWPKSDYNRAVKAASERFAGFDVMEVIAEGEMKEGKSTIIDTTAGLDLMQKFQSYMELDPEVGATFSFADFVPKVNQLLHAGSPKCNVIPDSDRDAGAFSWLVLTGSGVTPGDFDTLVTPIPNAANIMVWYKDHRGKTITRAISRAQKFIDMTEELQQRSKIKLHPATGTIGLNAANNEIIKRLEPVTVALISLVIFIVTSYIYRSFTAGLLLVMISNMANFMTAAVMYLLGIGLDVNTLPVAAVGMGIGIDYNIYLMSRMCEEYRINPNYARLVPASIVTTGKAIFFTATTMIGGVIIWYFLADLRFTADMALLLSAVMFAHVVLALLYQAAVMSILQPGFIKTGLLSQKGGNIKTTAILWVKKFIPRRNDS